MSVMDIDFSTLLLEFRAEMNWSQTELAKAIGVSQRMVSAIELKERLPSRVVEHKIFEALSENGLTAAHFLDKHNPVIVERIAHLVDGAGGCEHVAELLGVSVDDVLDWKRGKKSLEGSAFDKMCEVFKVAPEWLDGLGDDPDVDVDTPIQTLTGGRRIRLVEEQVRVLRKSLGVDTYGHWTEDGFIKDDGYWIEDGIIGDICQRLEKLEWFTGVKENDKYAPPGESLTTEEQGIVEVYRSLSAADKFDFIGVVNEYRDRLGSGPKSQEKVRKKSTGTQQLSA